MKLNALNPGCLPWLALARGVYAASPFRLTATPVPQGTLKRTEVRAPVAARAGRFVMASLAVLAFAGLPALAAEPGLLKSEFIYESAPFPQCHASTIAETRDGLVAAWFGGTQERHPDVGIWVARNVGGKWTTPVEVANGIQSPTNRLPCWNPVLFQPKSGPLMLFYKVGPSPSTWWGMLLTSPDAGKTWSQPRRLPDGILGPIKNKPVQLPNGDLLCPTSSEHAGWRVHFERTPDLGKTWSKTEPLNDGKTIGAIQPSVLFHPEGRLQALGRSRQGKLWDAWSPDGGKTWGPMNLLTLPNPNAQGRQTVKRLFGCKSPFLHFMDQSGEDARAGTPQRMPEGNRPAVYVYHGLIKSKITEQRQRLHRKSFIQLNQLDVIDG